MADWLGSETCDHLPQQPPEPALIPTPFGLHGQSGRLDARQPNPLDAGPVKIGELQTQFGNAIAMPKAKAKTKVKAKAKAKATASSSGLPTVPGTKGLHGKAKSLAEFPGAGKAKKLCGIPRYQPQEFLCSSS